MTETKRGLLAVLLAVLLTVGLAACRQPQPPGGGGEGDGARWNEAVWNEDAWN
jgi:hypothetical protein